MKICGREMEVTVMVSPAFGSLRTSPSDEKKAGSVEGSCVERRGCETSVEGAVKLIREMKPLQP